MGTLHEQIMAVMNEADALIQSCQHDELFEIDSLEETLTKIYMQVEESAEKNKYKKPLEQLHEKLLLLTQTIQKKCDHLSTLLVQNHQGAQAAKSYLKVLNKTGGLQ